MAQVVPVEDPPPSEAVAATAERNGASDGAVKAAAAADKFGTDSPPAVGRKHKSTRQRLASTFGLAPSHSLFTDKRVLANSLAAVRWACFVDVCCQTVLQPNFPYMCIPDYHQDSFPNIKPFKFATAQYFIPCAPAIGSAIASLVFGPLSDRIGRKPCMLICLYLGAVGSVLKYFARQTFWGFNAANFANGLVGASLVVGMAYVGDVYPDDKEKANEELGALMGLMMLGMSAGNVIAILMEEQGLFMPLWAAAALSLSGGIAASIWMVEADRSLHKDAHQETHVPHSEGEDDGGGEEEKTGEPGTENPWQPTRINFKLFWMIMFGCILDNLGSSGLTMAMSPLMLEEYQLDFILDEEKPLMNDNGYKWITTCVALAIIPAIPISMAVYNKIGIAGGCVLGNAFTVVVTLGLLFITKNEATKAWFISFILVLYGGYPMTVLSQLTTGPMIDAIAPEDMRGTLQGYNNGVTQFVMAGGPVVLGLIADEMNTEFCIWLCIGLSCAAAVANVPLMHYPQLMWAKDPNAKEHHEHEEDLGSDEDLIKRAEAGEWIPSAELDRINEDRMKKGLPFLMLKYGKYENDKDFLGKLKKRAAKDFKHYQDECAKWLQEMRDAGPEGREEMVKMMLNSRPSPDFIKQQKKELGEWFTDYLMDNGYWIENDPTPMKMMIMGAFPRLVRDINADNLEIGTLLMMKVMNNHMTLANATEGTVTGLLASKAYTRRSSVSNKKED